MMNTKTRLTNPRSPKAKFYVGEQALVGYVHRDDSNLLRAHVGQVGTVIGRTTYVDTPGNRYYVQFSDGYVGGYESWLLERVQK